MRCKCNKEIELDWMYCPECGRKIYDNEEEHQDFYISKVLSRNIIFSIANLILTYCMYVNSDRLFLFVIGVLIVVISSIISFTRINNIKSNKINTLFYKIFESILKIIIVFEIEFVLLYSYFM